MKNLLFVFALVAIAQCIPDVANYKFSPEQMQRNFFRPVQRDSIYGECQTGVFNSAQAVFNDALGMITEITWRNSATLNRIVNNMTLQGNGDGLNTVCNARQLYAQTLGMTYPWCVNRFYLLGQGETDFQNVIYYVHLYKHLEFLCSAAFNVYASQTVCIKYVQSLPDTNNCFTQFNQANDANPNNLCGNVGVLTKCIQNVYTKNCDVPTGWTECELERLGFAYDCPNLVCSVSN